MKLKSSQHPNRETRRAERGSAYILALLVLVILTLIGLSLAVMTSTELQLGASERVLQRVFYSADWGMDASAARALAMADYSAKEYTVPESDNFGAFNFRSEVDVSAFFPILASACNLCEINNVGQYGEKNYYQVTHAVSSSADRVGGVDTSTAEKTLASMLDVQPWELVPQALFPIQDPAELAKVKF